MSGDQFEEFQEQSTQNASKCQVSQRDEKFSTVMVKVFQSDKCQVVSSDQCRSVSELL